ncbi:MAG: rubrerythrin-like domain-containing protein [Haloarculaceae archaeon]
MVPAHMIFECMDCGRRTDADEGGRTCPSCGGPLQNLSVPREQ